MSRTLTVTFEPSSEGISARRFAKALADVVKVFDAVDHAFHQESVHDGWIIEALKSSAPTVTLRPRRNGSDIADVIASGVAAIGRANDAPPAYFTETALNGIHSLRSHVGARGSFAHIGVGRDGHAEATITMETTANAEKILEKGYKNIGSVKGRLDALNVHNKPVGTLWDRVTGAPVRFTFEHGAIERVKSMVAHDVLVSGTVLYFGNGTPRSIHDVVAIEDASRKVYAESATFGAVPDLDVRERGADAVLGALWEGTTR